MKQSNVIIKVDYDYNEEIFWQNDSVRNLWDSISECESQSVPMSAKNAEKIMEKFREFPGYYDDPNGNEPFAVVEED